MRRRFAIYPTRAPRSPREPRPGRRGLSEADVRAILYRPVPPRFFVFPDPTPAQRAELERVITNALEAAGEHPGPWL